jgi:hypothetical protein
MIFAPMISKKRRQQSEADSDSDKKSTERPLLGFRPVYVWDVAQTDGEPLPKLHEVSGDAGKNLARLVQFVIGRGITLGLLGRDLPSARSFLWRQDSATAGYGRGRAVHHAGA